MTRPATRHRALSGVLPAVVGVLLVVCAALVIVGVSLERNGEDSHTDTGAVESTEHAEGENDGSGEETHDENAGRGENTGRGEDAVHDEEAVLGMRIESPAALAGLAVVSVGMALLVWRRPTRLVTAAVVVVSVGAGVLDAMEIGRQLSADRVGLAALAVVIAVLRLATVTGAAVLWRTTQPRTAQPT